MNEYYGIIVSSLILGFIGGAAFGIHMARKYYREYHPLSGWVCEGEIK